MVSQKTRSNRIGDWFLRLALAMGVVLSAMAVSAPAEAQDAKIGYVDLQRALNEVDEGKKAKKRLEKEFEQKQSKLDKKQKQVKELKEQLDSSMMLSEEAKQKKAVELQKQLAELQQLYMKMQRDLAKKEAEATQKIFKKMGAIVEDIAQEKDYDLILEKTESSVLYANDGMDLTDELIKRYDK
ncbi:MAG: OmpH family outer membrane protein [Myxococcota bacterium]